MKTQKGVTLLELMITVAVVGLIAGIAYPSYQSQVQKSRRAEAKVSLERQAQRAERCFRTNQPWSYTGCVTAGDTENGLYAITVNQADAAGFSITATAQGPQLKDKSCRTFTLSSTNNPTATDSASVDSTALCWKR